MFFLADYSPLVLRLLFTLFSPSCFRRVLTDFRLPRGAPSAFVLCAVVATRECQSFCRWQNNRGFDTHDVLCIPLLQADLIYSFHDRERHAKHKDVTISTRAC